jgi:hypothetical protein
MPKNPLKRYMEKSDQRRGLLDKILCTRNPGDLHTRLAILFVSWSHTLKFSNGTRASIAGLTASFHIPSHLLPSNRPTIRRYAVSAIQTVVK